MLRKLKHYLMAQSREKKFKELLALLDIQQETSILDIGVNDTEYSPVDNYFEKKYTHPENITVLSIQKLNHFVKRYPEITPVYYGGGQFPFDDNSFSVVISNAVIEHVGGRKEQVRFVNEMLRVGEKVYFTTPAKEFPIEIHTNYPFVHWLPKQYFDTFITWAGKSWAAGDYMHLLSRRSIRQIIDQSNAGKSRVITHRIGPFPLHYIVVIQ